MDLAHDRSGTGEPLVLLHGVGHRRQGWEPVFDRLAKSRDVVAVDLPGHGESPALPVPDRGDHLKLTEAVESFLAGLGLRRPHVAGNSFGGLLALEMGARGTASSVTAISPAGFATGLEMRNIVRTLRFAKRFGSRMTRERATRLVANPASRVALFGLMYGRPSRHDPAVLVDDMLRYGEPNDTFDRLMANARDIDFKGRPAERTIIGWGTRDLVLPRWHATRARRQIPGAAVYLLPRCGHAPMGDDPDLVTELLLAGSRPVG